MGSIQNKRAGNYEPPSTSDFDMLSAQGTNDSLIEEEIRMKEYCYNICSKQIAAASPPGKIVVVKS